MDNGIDILAIHFSNLEGLSLLHTTDAVVSEIRSAVNSGHTVFIPREDIVLGSWSGTGYLVLDRDGTGAYMISGGLNGGSTCEEVTYFAMLELGLTLVDIMEGLICIFQAISVMKIAEAVSLLGVG